MSNMEQVEFILSNLLLALQVCLGIWQFSKLTPVGALIKGAGCWSLTPLRLSTIYTPLQRCPGRVFKKVKSYVLQEGLLSQKRDIKAGGRDTMKLYYLGGTFLIERRGRDMNMLFIKDVMSYYITPQIWDELETLTHVLNVDIVAGFASASAAAAAAAYAAGVSAVIAAEAASHHAHVIAARASWQHLADRATWHDHDVDSDAFAADYVNSAIFAGDDPAAIDAATYYAGAAAAAAVAADANLYVSVFVKGQRQFWDAMSTGGVMTLEEVLDEIILYNKHVGARLYDDWLLPVNLSVSEEKLLKIINLFALFLQTKTVKVHWLIPTSLSFISALLEFSTTIRVCIYEHINLCFCNMMHFICDQFPRSWRRQVYFLGIWVENLKPCNDIEQKIVRGNMCATIAGGAKLDKEGATLVPWISVDYNREQRHRAVDREFRCNPIDRNIKCVYSGGQHMCDISAPTITEFRVDCNSTTDFEKIITFVSIIAKNGCGSLKCYGPHKCCGSLKCYGPHKKVSVRGFRESVIFYVKSGFPPVYELELDNVVVA